MNDFRPVALTSVAMCLEKLVLKAMDSIFPITTDPLKFTYRINRSVEYTVALALHLAVEHLDTPNKYCLSECSFWTTVQRLILYCPLN